MTRPLVTTTLFAALVAGCADDAPAPPASAPTIRCDLPGPATMVISRFGFVRGDPMRMGVADGFDLDEHDSAGGDHIGCGRADFTAPDGRRGIDNQLALLIPIVDSMTGGALDGAIQGAINNGQLLLALTIDDMQNRCEDPSVTVTFQRVQGMPFVGGDMRVDPGQTFDLMRGTPVTRARGRIQGGVITLDRTDIPLPVEVLTARFILNLYGARMRLRFDDAGGAEALIGGGISGPEFVRISADFKIPTALHNTIGSSLRLFADLAPDNTGRCQNVSASVALSLRPAFVNP